MGDIRCVTCREPWDVYGLRHGDGRPDAGYARSAEERRALGSVATARAMLAEAWPAAPAYVVDQGAVYVATEARYVMTGVSGDRLADDHPTVARLGRALKLAGEELDGRVYTAVRAGTGCPACWSGRVPAHV